MSATAAPAQDTLGPMLVEALREHNAALVRSADEIPGLTHCLALGVCIEGQEKWLVFDTSRTTFHAQFAEEVTNGMREECAIRGMEYRGAWAASFVLQEAATLVKDGMFFNRNSQ